MDWKNHDAFTSTVTGKKLQSTNCKEEEDMNESYNLSASDVASAKSSISVSTESSLKEGMKMSKFLYNDFTEGEVNGKSSLREASVSSGEPFTGLKLGKRTYFEHNLGKSAQIIPSPRCQVEGCNLDLSSAKGYHKKHRVCGTHSKCPKVVISGLERRFCQQCSRFHSLAEFDEKKRSCRIRLSDHNARRRKPKHETIQFNSTNISSSFYAGGEQQLSFRSTPAVMKPKRSGTIDGITLTQVPNTVDIPHIAFNRPLPLKGASFEILDHGFKESLTPNVNAVDIRGALSLLSNNSWGIHEPDLTKLQPNHPHPMGSDSLFVVQPHGLPVSSPGYWENEQQSIDPHVHAKTGNSQFQEFQLFDRFYSNPMDEILKPLNF